MPERAFIPWRWSHRQLWATYMDTEPSSSSPKGLQVLLTAESFLQLLPRLCVYVYVCVSVGVCMCVGGTCTSGSQRFMSGVLLNCSLAYILKQGLLLNLELISLARPHGTWASPWGLPMCASGPLDSKPGSSCLYSGHVANRIIVLAWNLSFSELSGHPINVKLWETNESCWRPWKGIKVN